MQTLTVNVPQALRAKLQTYQNDQNIEQTEAAMIAALEAYFEDWTPTKKAPPLPAMYDAEDGPCEVVRSFLEPSHPVSGHNTEQSQCC